MKQIKQGDIVFCLKTEDKESQFYTEPDFGFVVSLEPGSWLEETEDSVTIVRNPMAGLNAFSRPEDSEMRTYPITQVMHIEDFIERFGSLPQDPYKIQSHLWGTNND
tara:strand:+ start:715 stop:1035 length:321 start_codon:yes stop_codon:yes gene_type:complete